MNNTEITPELLLEKGFKKTDYREENLLQKGQSVASL